MSPVPREDHLFRVCRSESEARPLKGSWEGDSVSPPVCGCAPFFFLILGTATVLSFARRVLCLAVLFLQHPIVGDVAIFPCSVGSALHVCTCVRASVPYHISKLDLFSYFIIVCPYFTLISSLLFLSSNCFLLI